jgi:hypothetical protein
MTAATADGTIKVAPLTLIVGGHAEGAAVDAMLMMY